MGVILDKPAIMQAVCERVARGDLVKDAAKAEGVCARSIREWGLDPEFAPLYARARADQAHAIAEQALAIADEDVGTSEQVQRNRLRVDTRKWLASKIAPRLFGERIQQEISGPDGGPIQHAVQAWQFGDKTVTF